MEFLVRLGTPDGRVFEEVHRAADATVLKGDLERRGLRIFEIRRKGLSLRPRLPAFARRRRIPPLAFLVFNQELAALLKAGLPLLQALDLMLERLRDPQFRSVLTDIRDRVKSGEDLSQAFAAYGEMFPALYPSTLKAGERTGELEAVIRRFIRYLKLVLEARKKVISALVYPAVLVGLSFAMIVVMTVYVVPKFTVFFSDMEVELPLLTRITLGISRFMTANWPWLLGALVLGAIVLRRWARTAGGRLALDAAQLRIPLLGRVFKQFAISEFARSLSTLLGGGIPLVQALEIAVAAVGNLFVRRRLEPTIQQVREGKAFNVALESAAVFDPLEIDMVKVGEATGSLDVMLSSVAEFLDEQVETRMARILALVEPLMLVFMGGIVAILLISIYMPLFASLSQSKF
jgi:type IV pilus assembly protein PilC